MRSGQPIWRARKTRSGALPRLVLHAVLALLTETALAHPQPDQTFDEASAVNLEPVEVEGRGSDLLGIAGSASQGQVGAPEFEYRPLSRAGELVEVIPGTLATQHSGSGKANQFFLRGFNLDHGTDFSVHVDGVPMNLPSHAHGQGYLDLNSIIPELVDNVEFGKGPYYAEAGDFSSAGYARMHSVHRLPQGFIKLTGGEYNHYRVVAADSGAVGPGELLYAGEVNFYDGPWQKPERLGKYNGLVRYTIDRADWGGSVIGKAYHGNWDATNQIARRAVERGLISRFGSLDTSDGGTSSRYSLSGNLWSQTGSQRNEVNLYAVYYDLDLFSNFTYFLENPDHGDQIEQRERRFIVGGNGERTWYADWFGRDVTNTLGLQLRHDAIPDLQLNHSQRRRLLNRVRRDEVEETSIGVYLKNETRWRKKFRTLVGLRSDFFGFEVQSRSLSINSGDRSATQLSPKLSFILGPWHDTEFFLNLGYGYHSNDARGATISRDPVTGRSAHRVDPLVASRGGEIGLRSRGLSSLDTTLALWWMELDSELVFVGDAGATEPSGKSERYGVEWTNLYRPVDWLTLDADFAFTAARFSDAPATKNDVPNSVGRVISAGATVELPSGLFAALRLRHFGQVPLTEDGGVKAGSTSLVNLAAGYQRKNLRVEMAVFNLFDSKDKDIAYSYDSRLRSEPRGASVPDIHFHPVEPRAVRVTATLRF
jgi:hypothetical protein